MKMHMQCLIFKTRIIRIVSFENYVFNVSMWQDKMKPVFLTCVIYQDINEYALEEKKDEKLEKIL
jgi:hypothetical protein